VQTAKVNGGAEGVRGNQGLIKNRNKMKKEKINAKLAYAEVMDVLKKHKDICVFDIDDLDRRAACHLFGIKLKEDYGLDIDPKRVESLQWLNYKEYCHIGWWGKKYNRTISWPDDKQQPEDNLLLEISFPTGPYIFGFGSMFNQEYPQEFFQKFWHELRSYNPDYVDSHNNSLYWKIENASVIFNSFDDIMQKFNDLNKEDVKQRKIKAMKDELSKLEVAE
jgi:hypothetical protein